MLTLSEQFFLLSFNSQKATFSTWYYLTKFDYGLCGALLFELILAEKIILSEQKEFVVNEAITLDKAWIEDLLKTIEKKKWFNIIFGKKHEKTLLHWIKVLKMERHIVGEHTKKALKERGMLGEKPLKLLGFKVSTATILQNENSQQVLKEKLENVILAKEDPDLQIFMLLRLLKGVKVIGDIFVEKSKEEKQILEDKLNLLFEKDEFSEAMKLLLSELQQEKIEEMTDLFDTLADAISDIGGAMDSVGDGGSDGGDGGGDGGD